MRLVGVCSGGWGVRGLVFAEHLDAVGLGRRPPLREKPRTAFLDSPARGGVTGKCPAGSGGDAGGAFPRVTPPSRGSREKGVLAFSRRGGWPDESPRWIQRVLAFSRRGGWRMNHFVGLKGSSPFLGGGAGRMNRLVGLKGSSPFLGGGAGRMRRLVGFRLRGAYNRRSDPRMHAGNAPAALPRRVCAVCAHRDCAGDLAVVSRVWPCLRGQALW